MPPFWLCLPAAAHSCLHYYSGGPFGVHNVRPGFPWLCQGKLELSNTLVSRKTLSSSKPPRKESSFAAFLSVPDGIPSPGLRSRGTFQGSVLMVPRGSGQSRQKGLPTGPRGPVPIQPRAGRSRLFRCFLWARRPWRPGPASCDASWPSRAKRLRIEK